MVQFGRIQYIDTQTEGEELHANTQLESSKARHDNPSTTTDRQKGQGEVRNRVPGTTRGRGPDVSRGT